MPFNLHRIGFLGVFQIRTALKTNGCYSVARCKNEDGLNGKLRNKQSVFSGGISHQVKSKPTILYNRQLRGPGYLFTVKNREQAYIEDRRDGTNERKLYKLLNPKY